MSMLLDDVLDELPSRLKKTRDKREKPDDAKDASEKRQISRHGNRELVNKHEKSEKLRSSVERSEEPGGRRRKPLSESVSHKKRPRCKQLLNAGERRGDEDLKLKLPSVRMKDVGRMQATTI